MLHGDVIKLSRAGKELAANRPYSATAGRLPPSVKAIYARCLPAGRLPELLQLFHDHPVLHRKHIFNNALENLPGSQRELVPAFYEEMVNKLGILPNATSVAKVIRVLGKLQRESDAMALWHDWLVCP